MTVIIGVDPHKATHTAVAIDSDERPLARLDVVAERSQTQRLLAWAAPLGKDRRWAVESADGLGKLLAQQLVAAGEDVVDVPPTLAARVRLLGSTKASKNDPNDALATAVAGLGHCGLRAVRVDDHSAVIRMLVDRYDDLTGLRTQAACRLHVALRELIAGGAPKRLSADRAARMLRSVRPVGVAEIERKRLASELLGDVRRLDREIVTARARVAHAVAKSATTLLELHGVGPIVAGFILGHVGDPRRFGQPRAVRLLQRHRPHRSVQRANETTPAQPPRQPQTEPRHPHGRRHPGPPQHTGTGLLPAQAQRRKVQEKSPASAQASHQRRRVAPATSRSQPPLIERAREDNQGRLFNPAWPAEP